MNDVIKLLDGLPSWLRHMVVVAIATAISTWLITTWLPNPLQARVEEHLVVERTQTKLLRRICENTARSEFEAGRCHAAYAGRNGDPHDEAP